MKSGRCFLLTLVASILLGGTLLSDAASKPVLVHYMPWYVAKPYSGSWGWHWTMNHYNPDTTDSSGRRQIASWYYPLIGPYDSADPAVLEYHVLLMKLGGIDGVVVDWYGNDNYADYAVNNVRTAALLYYVRKAGLQFSICYEDQTIQNEINGKYITSANALSHAQQTMLYLQNTYFSDASYLRTASANQPVLLNFGPQYFKTSANWQSLFSVLAATNQPWFFTEDSRCSPAATGAFDWPPMWMSLTNAGTVTAAQLQTYLNNFQTSAKSWPAYVSSAFPRYHDIYQQAGTGTSNGYLDDANASILTNTLSRAMTNGSAYVQVVTWNDYGEGTIVEPTLDYGYRDLGLIQDLRRQYLDASFPYHTNDLTFALRLYNLRKQYGATPILLAELDRAFTNLITGQLAAANLQLSGLESTHLAIYNLSGNANRLQFCVGGALPSAGVVVQTTSDLNSGNWQTLSSFAASTNPLIFNTSISPGSTPVFFRAKSAP